MASAEGTSSEGYHDYAALTKALHQLADSHKNMTSLISIGKTLKGNDLWMLQITGIKGPSPEEKQALLICGNAEGDHLIGSEVTLGIAENLVKNYGQDEQITDILDKRTFYIIPRLNPDGAELFFKNILLEHSGNLNPRDEDYDWLIDEDGPEDLNGDGIITLMRIKDQEGDWTIDDKDPRLMKKKEDDTPLDKLYKIFPEGIDDDGDERYNEDGPGGFNINRNFPHNFGYNAKGLKVYPASEIETQALIDFMTKYIPEKKGQPHRNICGVLIFSKYDNLAAGSGIECGTPTFPEPPQAEQGAATMMRMFFMMGRRGGEQEAPRMPPRDPQPKKTETRDEPLFKKVSETYKELTGIKSALSEKPYGSLLEYAYFQFGVPAFSANLWSLRQDEGSRSQPEMKREAAGPPTTPPAQMDRSMMFQRFAAARGASSQAGSGSSDDKWLAWLDKEYEGKGFVSWEKFDHKQLGEVEIGGFFPYLRVNPPAEKINSLVESHTEFAVYLASQFADIHMDEPVVKKLSDGVYELKIKVKNRGEFPYATAMGQRTSNITPIMLRLKFQDDDTMELFGGNRRIDIRNLDPSEEKEYKWVLLSPSNKKIDITLWARNGGGTIEKQIVLK